MNNGIFSMVAIMGFIWLILVGAMALLPYYTRKSIAFGVAVPPEQNREEFLKGLRRHYVQITGIMGMVLAAVSLFALIRMDEQTAAVLNIGTILLYVILAFFVFARCNIVVRNFKRNSDWVVRSSSAAVLVSRDDQRKLFNPLWYLTQLLLVTGVTAYSILLYPRLPAQLPVQTDFSGTVLRYADTSYWAILQLPLVMLFMLVLFAGIGLMINSAKRQTDDINIERGFYNNRSFQIIMGKVMFWLGALIQAIMIAAQLLILGIIGADVILWLTVGLLTAVVLGMLYLAVSVGQGGYRLSGADGEGEDHIAEDDQYWVFFATFYNNPNDPTLFIERRIGIGWTINIGRPAGKAILIVLSVAIVALVAATPFLMTSS